MDTLIIKISPKIFLFDKHISNILMVLLLFLIIIIILNVLIVAYERGHQRPPLTVYTFHAPEGTQQSQSQPASPIAPASGSATPVASPQAPIYARPPIPQRCSSLERPSVPSKNNLKIHFSPSNKIDNYSGKK